MDKPEKRPRVGSGVPGPGRPKGSKNRVPAELKEMILGALDDAGGQEYLLERAQDPKTAQAFLTLVGKVLPMTIDGQASLTVHWPVMPPKIER